MLQLSQCFHREENRVLTFFFLFSDQVGGDEVVDSKILPYCSIDKKEKKSLGELEQDFLQALQVWKDIFTLS